MQNNKSNLSTSEQRVILGIKVGKYCKHTNDREGFRVGVEVISTGIREQIQHGKSLQSIGELFTNEQ